MFANAFSRRSDNISFRPISWSPKSTTSTVKDKALAARSRSRSPAPSSSTISPSHFTYHENDSEATIGNDILILQIAKEMKDVESDHPYSYPPVSAYVDIATRSPYDDEANSDPQSPSSVTFDSLSSRLSSTSSNRVCAICSAESHSTKSHRRNTYANKALLTLDDRRMMSGEWYNTKAPDTGRRNSRDRYSTRSLVEEMLNDSDDQ